jgi:ABC-2 type transport system ATP-binding protein
MNQVWIDIHDLRLERGGRLVLQGVNASLSGHAIGLVGANGAGKSTLIGALLGVLKPSSGSIRVLDLDIPSRAMDLRARAGVMAEQAGVFPGGSGVDAVVFAGMLSGLSRREALRRSHRALDALDVGEERYRPASGYSTGMKQRTKLAMSLVHDPEILILDEPTVGLDPMGRTQLLRLILDLRDQGRRILLSTHVLQDAEAVCDDMLLLQGGVVAFSGGVHRLLGGEDGRMLATGSGFDDAFAGRLSDLGFSEINGSGERLVFRARADGDLLPFWTLAAERGAEVRFLGRDHPTLEEAVIAVMEEAPRGR